MLLPKLKKRFDKTRRFQSCTVIYIDGACYGNRDLEIESIGSIGIYFGPKCEYNRAEELPKTFKRHSNNDAKIYAAFRALMIARKAGFLKVELRTDCKLLVDYASTYRLDRFNDYM